MLLPLQGESAVVFITQGAASLCPGLCARCPFGARRRHHSTHILYPAKLVFRATNDLSSYAPGSGLIVAVLWARRSLAFPEVRPYPYVLSLPIVFRCQEQQTDLLFVVVKNLELKIIACIDAALNERAFLSHRLDQCWAHFLIL